MGLGSGKSNGSGTWINSMKHPEPIRRLFAVCISNAEYPASLERHKIHQVLPDEEVARDGDIRAIDESGEDYLYPASFFVAIEVPQEVERAILHASCGRRGQSGSTLTARGPSRSTVPLLSRPWPVTALPHLGGLAEGGARRGTVI
jgi:hypothetical protein